MAIAAFEEFALELVYHQSSLAGIQIVTSDDSLFAHLQYLSDRTRKILVDIRLRLAQLKKERSMISTHVIPASAWHLSGGEAAPTPMEATSRMPPYVSRRRDPPRRPASVHV